MSGCNVAWPGWLIKRDTQYSAIHATMHFSKWYQLKSATYYWLQYLSSWPLAQCVQCLNAVLWWPSHAIFWLSIPPTLWPLWWPPLCKWLTVKIPWNDSHSTLTQMSMYSLKYPLLPVKYVVIGTIHTDIWWYHWLLFVYLKKYSDDSVFIWWRRLATDYQWLSQYWLSKLLAIQCLFNAMTDIFNIVSYSGNENIQISVMWLKPKYNDVM